MYCPYGVDFSERYSVQTILSISGQRREKYRHEYEIFQKTTQVAQESISRVLYLCSFVKCSCPFHSLSSPTYKLYYPWLLLILMLMVFPRFLNKNIEQNRLKCEFKSTYSMRRWLCILLFRNLILYLPNIRTMKHRETYVTTLSIAKFIYHQW
jgi:hypothetical protein